MRSGERLRKFIWKRASVLLVVVDGNVWSSVEKDQGELTWPWLGPILNWPIQSRRDIETISGHADSDRDVYSPLLLDMVRVLSK